ncbi:MAG: redoxin domain-containing protein [Lachnospiraceae bacterium]|nr:redoxin domain-containing protein [Lachnospiraceae bacterium]
MNLSIEESISAITVLLQGFLSFFSPCVLPLLPLYIGYLSGVGPSSGGSSDEEPSYEKPSDGKTGINRKRVLINTIFFVIGIGFSFFLLGLGMRTVGRFFGTNRMIFARIGGVLVILFGLYQLGIFGDSSLLMREKRLPFNLDKMAMSPLTALIMGFVFSFAWTPCVGPVLSSVLLMAGSAESSAAGFALVGVYTIGFALPFLLTGIFTTSILAFFKKKRNVVRYTVKISGALLIIMGALMITGHMNSITGYLSRLSGSEESIEDEEDEDVDDADDEEEDADEEVDAEDEDDVDEDADTDSADTKEDDISGKTGRKDDDTSGKKDGKDDIEEEEDTKESESAKETDLLPAPDFTLTDQYGVTHTLSDYKGKVVFLNFWATWCPPCRQEMPDIQAFYEKSQSDPDSELVILGVAFPDMGGELSEEGIKDFLDENGYTYPTLMDKSGSLLYPYYISAYPTTYMIDRDGNVFGSITGSLSRRVMGDIISQTLKGIRK